jgi:hypothetical protein
MRDGMAAKPELKSWWMPKGTGRVGVDMLSPGISAVLKKKLTRTPGGRCHPKESRDSSPGKLRCLFRSQWSWKRAHLPPGPRHGVKGQGVEGRCSRSMSSFHCPGAARLAALEPKPSTQATCGLLCFATWSRLASWSVWRFWCRFE